MRGDRYGDAFDVPPAVETGAKRCGRAAATAPSIEGRRLYRDTRPSARNRS